MVTKILNQHPRFLLCVLIEEQNYHPRHSEDLKSHKEVQCVHKSSSVSRITSQNPETAIKSEIYKVLLPHCATLRPHTPEAKTHYGSMK